MTEAEKAAALADEIELGKETTGDDSAEIALVVRSLRRLAETEARPSADLREVVADAICKFNGDKTNSGYSMSPIYEEERDCADAILSAIAASGYAAVPREPTEEMVERTARALCLADSWSPDGKDFFGDIANWRNYETPARLALRTAFKGSAQ